MMRRTLTFVGLGAALIVGGAAALTVFMLRPPEPPVPADFAGADRDLVQRIEQAVAEVRDDPHDHARWLKLGMVYEANLYMPFAEECYKTSAELGGGALATYHLGVLYSRMGDMNRAVEALQQTIEVDPSHGPAHWRLGFWLLDAHRLEEAEASFREAMSRRSGPFDLAGEIGLARVFLLRDELDRAEAVLRPLADRPSPYAAYACHLLGTALARKGDVEAARAALLRGRAGEPVFRDPLHEQVNQYYAGAERLLFEAKALLARGEHEGAVALLQQAAAERPDDRFVRNNLALALIGAGRFAEANEHLERVLHDAPGSSLSYFNMALASQARAAMSSGADAQAHRAEALAHLDEALRLNPSSAAALSTKADMLREDGRYEEALDLYFRALAMEPANVLWWHGAALSAAACGRREQAMMCVAQIEMLRPNDHQLARLIDAVEASIAAASGEPVPEPEIIPTRSQKVGP